MANPDEYYYYGFGRPFKEPAPPGYIGSWGRPFAEAARDNTAVDNSSLERAAETTAKGLLLEHFLKDRSLGPSVYDRIINNFPKKLPFMFMPPTGEFIEKQIQNSQKHKKLFPKEAPTT